MGSYSVRAEETELASLVSRAEAGEEIVLSRDGLAVAKIIPFPEAAAAGGPERTQRSGQAYGQHISGSSHSPEGFDEALSTNQTKLPQRRSGQNFSGLAGTDLSWLDEPLPEDMQRAFGMID